MARTKKREPKAQPKKLSKKAWTEAVWSKVPDAQFEEIKSVCGKKAAETANYGWGDATGFHDGRVDVATKVYLRGGNRVLSTTAEYPSGELSHEWSDY